MAKAEWSIAWPTCSSRTLHILLDLQSFRGGSCCGVFEQSKLREDIEEYSGASGPSARPQGELKTSVANQLSGLRRVERVAQQWLVNCLLTFRLQLSDGPNCVQATVLWHPGSEGFNVRLSSPNCARVVRESFSLLIRLVRGSRMREALIASPSSFWHSLPGQYEKGQEGLPTSYHPDSAALVEMTSKAFAAPGGSEMRAHAIAFSVTSQAILGRVDQVRIDAR